MMSLIDLKTGQKARIIKIKKGISGARKMFEMGIIPGVEIEITGKHPFRGPLLCKVGNSQLALGRGLAASVEVELSGNNSKR